MLQTDTLVFAHATLATPTASNQSKRIRPRGKTSQAECQVRRDSRRGVERFGAVQQDCFVDGTSDASNLTLCPSLKADTALTIAHAIFDSLDLLTSSKFYASSFSLAADRRLQVKGSTLGTTFRFPSSSRFDHTLT